MVASRKYAEDLVGALDRSAYGNQRDVANQAYKTNWSSLQNQYKNLQEQLKQKQEQSNRDYAKGLVQVADNSFDRMRDANTNIATRGLSASGLGNLVQQADIDRKGKEIANMLKSAGDVATKTASQLKESNEIMANKEASLNNRLSNTLGNIGARETSAQMDYNTGLANIAGGKEARDMQNALAAAQRAAQSGAGKKSKEAEDIENKTEQYYKNKAITSILSGVNPDTGEPIDWDDSQKSVALKLLLDVENPKEVIEGFKKNAIATETYENKLKEIERNNQNKNSEINSGKIVEDVNNNATIEQKFLDQLLKNGENAQLDKTGQSRMLTDYLNQNYNLQGKQASPMITEEQARQALSKMVGPSGDLNYSSYQQGLNPFDNNVSLEDLINTYNDYKSGKSPLLSQQINNAITANKAAGNKAYTDFRNQGVSYTDLAKLLYGNK